MTDAGTSTPDGRQRRLSLSEIVERQLEALSHGASKRSSSTVTRNLKGQYQFAVDVVAGDDDLDVLARLVDRTIEAARTLDHAFPFVDPSPAGPTDG